MISGLCLSDCNFFEDVDVRRHFVQQRSSGQRRVTKTRGDENRHINGRQRWKNDVEVRSESCGGLHCIAD